jgi:hypothetical protein
MAFGQRRKYRNGSGKRLLAHTDSEGRTVFWWLLSKPSQVYLGLKL